MYFVPIRLLTARKVIAIKSPVSKYIRINSTCIGVTLQWLYIPKVVRFARLHPVLHPKHTRASEQKRLQLVQHISLHPCLSSVNMTASLKRGRTCQKISFLHMFLFPSLTLLTFFSGRANCVGARIGAGNLRQQTLALLSCGVRVS